MPTSITIAAFVLGAVLLLIAILHGSFKIFGAEVDGTAGRFGRIFAGLLGVVLIAIGLFSSLYKPSPQPAAGLQKSASDDSPSGAAQKPTGPAQSDQPVNIAGTWHDAEGNEFQVSQNGNAFTIRITGMSYEASSSGTLHGHDFERTYEGHMIASEGSVTKGTRFTGHCNGTVSDDAKVMRADCFDETGGRGPWQSVLTR
jgi:phosphotransferase system  glucose/maltose/N-acetylglucosamine-specific IIC component